MRVPDLETLIQAVENTHRSQNPTLPWKPTYPELSGIFSRLTYSTVVFINASELYDMVCGSCGIPSLMEQTDPVSWSYYRERVGHVKKWITNKYLERFEYREGDGYLVPNLMDVVSKAIRDHEDKAAWR